jgi:hypothetical protein
MTAPDSAPPPPLLTCFAAAAALLLEGKAAWEFLPPGHGVGAYLVPLGLMHLAAVSLLAFSLRHRRDGAGPDRHFALFVFVFCLALPLLGMIGILLGALPALGGSRPAPRPGYGVIRRERARAFPSGYPVRYGAGGFRARLLARAVPAPRRLGGLLALRRRPSPRGNLLLKEMLRDPADELRLAAYAALESRERESQAAIASAASALAAARDGAERLAAHRRMAYLQWEAVYQELAEGELSRHHLDHALRSADEALELAPGDGFLALLRGRILIRLGRWDEALLALAPVGGLGVPAARVLPYRAELSFRRGDFAAVRYHLAALRGRAAGGPLDDILHFWLDRGT